jgi:hypothetical protein
LDDIWVEVASGFFILGRYGYVHLLFSSWCWGGFATDIVPSNRESPYIQLVLSGGKSGTGRRGSSSASASNERNDSSDHEPGTSPPNTNKTGEQASGFSVKIKLEGLKLAGDSGKGIPKLQFDSLSVTLVLQANIRLTFDSVTQKWDCPPKHFQFQILSFKGPYGISKG